jgi:D-aminoacyl-tRNA deacylase
MKVIIQRVLQASVKIKEKIYSEIDQGLLILLGVAETDIGNEIDWLVKKIVNLRIFGDDNDKMNLSVKDVEGEILVVSQFTLYGDCKKGNRPSFTAAAKSEKAEKLYEEFVSKLKENGVKVKTGKFGAMMNVGLINNGPVTIEMER